MNNVIVSDTRMTFNSLSLHEEISWSRKIRVKKEEHVRKKSTKDEYNQKMESNNSLARFSERNVKKVWELKNMHNLLKEQFDMSGSDIRPTKAAGMLQYHYVKLEEDRERSWICVYSSNMGFRDFGSKERHWHRIMVVSKFDAKSL